MNSLIASYGDSDSPSPIIQSGSTESTNQEEQTLNKEQSSSNIHDEKKLEENIQLKDNHIEEKINEEIDLSNIPPSPKGECDPNLQAKIALFIQKHRDGLNLNEDLKRQKQFGNPEILDKIVQHFEIDELGSNYPKDIWDPHGLPKEDYYDKLGKVKTLQFH